MPLLARALSEPMGPSLGCSHVSTYRWDKNPGFPKPLQVGKHHPRWSLNQLVK